MISSPKFEIADAIIKEQYFRERSYAKYACRSISGKRYYPEREAVPDKENIRAIFAHDADRIIHSLSYSRYIDKTQVFYLIENDHISHRVLHVQLVAKIARTIGRVLNLNEDLVEAISLGHDVGHTPFGHNGEVIISDFCKRNNVGVFLHNSQSFRLFHEIENDGKGLNLTIQVLDGIICHNGEVLNLEYENDKSKDSKRLISEYLASLQKESASKEMIPMTLEGCVMRISDVIAYIGRDIEDAIKVDLIKREDLPSDITDLLGNNNRDIVNSLIVDIINNSYQKGKIIFSKDVFEALEKLKTWNYKNIYSNPRKMKQDGKIKNMFNEILESSLDFLNRDAGDEYVCIWLNSKNDEYKNSTEPARIVADFVSGMTDDFIMKTYENKIIPKTFGYKFK